MVMEKWVVGAGTAGKFDRKRVESFPLFHAPGPVDTEE